ncbi:hypothetical protein, partial [Cephaloticoccus primus]|uniref:LPD3 domain-containing protein n=1 Tax=Cephaloticoccus primus TaxID=1548207 RepID=UPI0012E7BF4F
MRTPEFKEWFGDWESLRAQKRLDEMEPVVVPIPDEWRGLSLEQWRSKMVDSLGSLMADERKGRLATAIVHPELGEIFVNRDGINKTKSASADPAKILVAANLKDVLPQAVYAHSRPLNKPKRDILIEGYATLYAKVEVGGVPLIAVFTVERKTDGKWYYNTVMRLASENEKTRKFQIGGLTGGPVQGAPLAGLAEGKRDVLHRVNPESVSKTVDPDTGEPSAEGLAESGEYTAGGIGSTGRPEGSSGRLAGTGVQGKAPVGSAGSQPGVLHSPLRLGQPNAARTELAGPASSAGQRPVSAPQVMGAIARVAEALGRDGRSVNRVGRVGNKRALGSYLLDAQVARIRSANDVSTAAHELAHAMDDALWGEPEHWKRNALGLQEQARAELERLGRDLYTEGEPHNGYHSEGFAEFVRLWLTDGPQAKEKAPTFAKWWQAEVLGKSPKLARAVEQAQELGTRWFTQGALLRAHSGIVEQPTRTQELVTTARREVSQLRKRWIEAAAAVEDLVEEAARLRGDPGGKLPVALDPMETLRAGRRKAEAKVDYFAQVGLT